MEYSYLLLGLFCSFVFGLIYFFRKDLRKSMLFVGLLVGVSGLFLEYFIWTKDWWQPDLIFGSVIGIEDFLFGFGVAGIILALYPLTFSKVFFDLKEGNNWKLFLLLFGLSNILGFGFFFVFGFNSFHASIIAMIVPSIIIYFFRRDLILPSLFSGILVVILFIPVYNLGFAIDPTAFDWWAKKSINEIFVFGTPLEDLLWFFGTGVYTSLLYPIFANKSFRRRKIK